MILLILNRGFNFIPTLYKIKYFMTIRLIEINGMNKEQIEQIQ